MTTVRKIACVDNPFQEFANGLRLEGRLGSGRVIRGLGSNRRNNLTRNKVKDSDVQDLCGLNRA